MMISEKTLLTTVSAFVLTWQLCTPSQLWAMDDNFVSFNSSHTPSLSVQVESKEAKAAKESNYEKEWERRKTMILTGSKPVDVREYTDKLVKEGNVYAIDYEINMRLTGTDDYPQDEATAVALNNGLADRGHAMARFRKHMGFRNEAYGYPKDLKAAAAYNDSLVEEGNSQAIKYKIGELTYGTHGEYPKSPEAAMAFIESLVAKGNKYGEKYKIEGLREGWYGYPKNPAHSLELENKRLAGDPQAAEEAAQARWSK